MSRRTQTFGGMAVDKAARFCLLPQGDGEAGRAGHGGLRMIRPGVTTGEVAAIWPPATEFGFRNEEGAFALQFGHRCGLSHWEKPIFSRLASLDHPDVIEESMCLALETLWPSSDGWSAARIEEQLVVTADGVEVITRFSAEELLVAGQRYWTARGPLATTREVTSDLNRDGAAPRLPEPHSVGD